MGITVKAETRCSFGESKKQSALVLLCGSFVVWFLVKTTLVA